MHALCVSCNETGNCVVYLDISKALDSISCYIVGVTKLVRYGLHK